MPSWSTYLKTFIVTVFLSVALVYLFIVLVDPYDNVPFSLPIERAPISTNRRFAYPSLARKKDFDSAIIGTSTARLLKPERLNQLTGDNWVNLAMNSATAYEQMQMLELFLRHHVEPKNIVIGIDDAWCHPANEVQKFTFRPFPPWMYDENPWNDLLYLFNDKALENAVRLVEFLSGKRKAKYDRTGYRDFTEDFGEYDLKIVRERFRSLAKKSLDLSHDDLVVANDEQVTRGRRFTFASHEFLRALSKEHRITIIFMPLNGSYLAGDKPRYEACKRGVLQAVSEIPNIRQIDQMTINASTLDIENYWDPLHFRTEVAKGLEAAIAQSSERRR